MEIVFCEGCTGFTELRVRGAVGISRDTTDKRTVDVKRCKPRN